MHWGGVLGGPVFKEVMSYVLESKRIPPTNTKINPMALNAAQLKKALAKETNSVKAEQ
jgi:cell division protein FtsI (penicillin-binding protein 3)